jgi:hypothetical protein
MLRVKIFSSATHGANLDEFEREINDWLDATHPAIRQMTQSTHFSQTAAGGGVVVTFLYEKQRGEDQAHLAAADIPEAFERDLDGAELDPTEDEPTVLPEAELPY